MQIEVQWVNGYRLRPAGFRRRALHYGVTSRREKVAYADRLDAEMRKAE